MEIYTWDEMPEKEPYDGVRRRMIVGEKLLILRQRFEAGCSAHGAHSHPDEQFCQVLEGRLEVTIEGEKVVLGPGQAVRFPPGCHHGMRALEDGPALMEEIFSPVPERVARLA